MVPDIREIYTLYPVHFQAKSYCHLTACLHCMCAGDLFLRPPHVVVATAVAGCVPCAEPGLGTACDSWQHADWLNCISVVNKQDYARLQGFRFIMIHAKVRRGSASEPPPPHPFVESDP